MLRDVNIPETVGIALAVLAAALVSTVSEQGSEKAFDSLEAAGHTTEYSVLRGGKEVFLHAEEIVTGDIVTIVQGVEIPADCIILKGEITANQSALTGEAKEIKKRGSVTFSTVTVPTVPLNPSCESHIFKGTLCTAGEATALAVSVGEKTVIGAVARDVQREKTPSPLKKKLHRLATTVSILGYISAGLIMTAYLFNAFVIDSRFVMGEILTKLHDVRFVASSLISAVTLGVSVIVVAVPEGLPMMITVVLSSNMKRMMKSGVLVRRPVGIETAGCMNVLFTDKTGTLTEGKMTVCRVMGNADKLKSLIRSGLCSVGNTATERAVLGWCGRCDPCTPAEKIPFSPVYKYSACLGDRCYIMGAPEKILPCVTGEMREEAAKGRRLLAVASAPKSEWENIKKGIVQNTAFHCVFVLSDPLRSGIKRAVTTAKRAGIQVVMITGDNRETAAAIAAEAGISGGCVLTGEEISRMNDSQLSALIPKLSVVARALPSHKMRLVELAKREGLVCGMTGDGVNDAPSLKSADVGFSMGSGSDVAKEAGDIILLDNSFHSIINAILYGRTVFQSIRKFIVFQLTMNLCALGVSLVGPFIGVDAPITVIQMLWVNIIMDTLGALAFAGEAPLQGYMKMPPARREESILTKSMTGEILTVGFYTLILCLGFLSMDFVKNLLSRADEKYFMTAFFALFIFAGIFNSFNARAPRGRLLSHLSANKAFISIMSFVGVAQLAIIYMGGATFRCVPLTLRDLAVTAALASTTLVVGSIRRAFVSHRT